MADIKSFKSSAGEVFVCFNEQSHSYKLFLNMLKNAELSSDTAIKNLATSINKAVSEAVNRKSSQRCCCTEQCFRRWLDT